MESASETDEPKVVTDSTRTESDTQNTGHLGFHLPTFSHGYISQKFEENTTSATLDATLPGQRCHSCVDAHCSGLSCGDQRFPKLSLINGAINKMTLQEMQKKLKEHNLNSSGVKEILKKRLKSYYKRRRMTQYSKALADDEKTKYSYLVVIDFEATCSQSNENFVHEIIEFPAVVVDVQKQTVCDTFQRFCKPRINPTLTDFCTTLTGISQSQVDKAKDFTDVLKDFEEWLSLHSLGTEHEFAVVTDGPCDMGKFLRTQVLLSNIEYPQWARQWINLRKVYTAFYASGRSNLQKMLDDLGLEFQGRPHCGLDDASNLAAIVLQLLQDGCNFRINEYFREGDAILPNLCDPSKASGDSNIHTTLIGPLLGQNNGEHDCKVQKLSDEATIKDQK